ncbi:DUF300-domain-containing protein, partial [Linderina pennispora]
WPASLVRRDLDLSDPYDYLFLKRGILQYVVVKPILAAATMLMRSTGVYRESSWGLASGYMWTQLVYNASVSLSLYCLVVFYMATKDHLAQWTLLPKFLCIKAIVFFSYWQGLGISILVALGLIHDTPELSADHIATFLQSWLICLEMVGGALGHWLSFSYHDYVPVFHLAGRVRLFHAVRDALGLKDVFVDAKSAWSGHQYTYRYFDPISTAAIHGGNSSSGGAIKERRLRAGMRYTQGGKKTYWLPVEPADHRAVAFAAGGAGKRAAMRQPDEHTRLVSGPPPAGADLAVLSMDLGEREMLSDDALYNDARTVEGDFNYPVVEVGVAFGFSRRRPYGHTISHRRSSEVGRPAIQGETFAVPASGYGAFA